MFPFLFKQLIGFFSYKEPSHSKSQLNTSPSEKNVHPEEISDPVEQVNQGAEGSLQQEIRQERKFSLAEAIAREGGSFLKGESTIPRPLRANNAIKQFINIQLADPSSAFSTTLFAWASNDIRVSRQLDTPLVALTQILESLLDEPTSFYEFARRVAIAHADLTGERPYFQQPGQPPHPDADYTHASIRAQLLEMVQFLKKEQNP